MVCPDIFWHAGSRDANWNSKSMIFFYYAYFFFKNIMFFKKHYNFIFLLVFKKAYTHSKKNAKMRKKRELQGGGNLVRIHFGAAVTAENEMNKESFKSSKNQNLLNKNIWCSLKLSPQLSTKKFLTMLKFMITKQK